MTGIEKGIFNRAQLLMGTDVMERMKATRVIVIGVGGVGSWCAESLIRSGIGHLTIVDSDRVCVTNINRQLMATKETVGRVKVDVLKDRLLTINPNAEIEALQKIYSSENAADFHLETYDYIIDAIDSLQNKADLIRHACTLPAVFLSAMGAALKLDPTRIHVAEFWKVKGCPLARALRNKFKRAKDYPAKKFKCVYSEELLTNRGQNKSCGTSACMCPKSKLADGDPDLVNHEWCSSKAQINGTMAHAVAIFGFTLAGLVIQDIYEKVVNAAQEKENKTTGEKDF